MVHWYHSFIPVAHRSWNTWNDGSGGGGGGGQHTCTSVAQEWIFNQLFIACKQKFVVTCRYNEVLLLYGNLKVLDLSTALASSEVFQTIIFHRSVGLL